MEIKGQVDATDGSLLQNLFFAQHVSCTIMPIIRSSRVLYRRSLPLVFDVLVYRLSVWCGAVGYVSGLRDAVASRKLTGSQPVKKFPAYYGTRRFITAFTSVHHLSLS